MPWTTSADRVRAMLAYSPPVERVTFPAPLRGSDETGGTPEVPAPVLKLQALSRGGGWVSSITYANGWMPHSTHGRPGPAPKESWALRMARGDQRAVAVYRGGAWDSMWFWSTERFFLAAGSLSDFQVMIVGEEMTEPSGSEWARMLAKYPLTPTKKQWAEIDKAWEGYFMRDVAVRRQGR